MEASRRRPGLISPEKNDQLQLGEWLKAYAKTNSRVRQIHYERGSAIFEKGEPAYWAYLLLEGEVDLVKRLANGKRFIVERLVSGDLLGIEALLAQSDYPDRDYVAEAVTSVDAILIERDDFMALLGDPEFAVRINRLLIQLLRKSSRRTGYLLCNNALEKVVGTLSYFNQLQRAETQTESSDTATLVLTLNQIASFAGITEETVFKQMKSLRRKKVISKSDRSGIELQLSKLAMISEA